MVVLLWLLWGSFLHFTQQPQLQMPALAQVLLGDLYALMAGLAWALSTIIVRLSPLAQAPATQTLFYQLFGCFVLLLLIAF